jgi:hypothetical protein
MRTKDAIDVERKAQSRHVEKQAKAIERLVDSERNLIAQVVCTGICGCDMDPIDKFHQGDLEKEVVQWKRRAESGEFKAEKLDRENIELKHVKAIGDYFTEKVCLQNVPFPLGSFIPSCPLSPRQPVRSTTSNWKGNEQISGNAKRLCCVTRGRPKSVLPSCKV